MIQHSVLENVRTLLLVTPSPKEKLTGTGLWTKVDRWKTKKKSNKVFLCDGCELRCTRGHSPPRLFALAFGDLSMV